jgi:hypothetical protein
MLTTLIPRLMHQSIAEISQLQLPIPSELSTFTAYREAAGATPTTPEPLIAAAIVPAQWVP